MSSAMSGVTYNKNNIRDLFFINLRILCACDIEQNATGFYKARLQKILLVTCALLNTHTEPGPQKIVPRDGSDQNAVFHYWQAVDMCVLHDLARIL